MGYNQKFIKLERVVEKVKRDFPGGYELDPSDVIEWIGEAISAIGAYSAYETKETDGNTSRGHLPPIAVSNYRAKLPCDLYKLNAIDIITSYNEKKKLVISQTAAASSSEIFLPNAGRTATENIRSEYKVRNGYIYFSNLEKGMLNISYEAFITDDRGWPMIPDDDRYVKALAAFIIERVGYRLMLMDSLTERKYDRLLADWLFYVNQAYAGSLLQNIDEAEAFKNSFVRFVTDSSARASDNYFENKQQSLKTHNLI